MKILVWAALVAMIPAMAQAQFCNLSDGDIAALAVSASKLTPKGFSALSPDDQNTVCLTRAFIKKLDAQNDVLSEAAVYSNDYLSPDELQRTVLANRAFLKAMLTAKGNH
jgi:hypothetical protein